MNSYKFRAHAAASSLPCAHRVQGEYCRCSEMGFTCTIAAALNRHIQKWKTDLFTNLSNRFFPSFFSNKLSHLYYTISHKPFPHGVISFYHVFSHRHQQDWRNQMCTAHVHTHTYAHTHMLVIQRQKRLHKQLGNECPPCKGQTCSIPQ